MQLLNARKAYDLDKNSDAANSAMASVNTWYLWDWKSAEKFWKKAIEINNNNPIALMYYGHFLACMGKFEEAMHVGEQAVTLDPFNPFLFGLYSIILMHAEEYDLALEIAKKSMEMDPNNIFPVSSASLINYGKGDLEGAYTFFRKSTIMARDTTRLEVLEEGYNAGGAKMAFCSVANLLAERSVNIPHTDHRLIGFLYDRCGDIESAIKWFQKSFDAHEVGMVYLRNTPVSDDLRTHEKFIAIQDSMRFQIPPKR